MRAGNIAFWLVGAAVFYLGWIINDMGSVQANRGASIGSSLARVQTAGVPVLVEFYADWCGPCRAVGPAVDELAAELAGRAEVIRLDVDTHGSDASSHGVRAIPTFIAFKGGKEVARQTGAIPKAKMKQMLGL